MSNKLLILILILLMAVLGFTYFFEWGGKQRTFKKELVDIDTSKVSDLYIYPKSLKGQEIHFVNNAGQWQMISGSENVNLESEKISSMINALLVLKPKNVAATNSNKWAEFQVDKEQATRVKVMEGNKTSLDMYIGKFSFQQRKPPPGFDPNDPQHQMMMQQMQQQPIMTSFVRVENDDKVYAVDGMLGMNFDRKPEDFIPKPPTPPVEADSTLKE